MLLLLLIISGALALGFGGVVAWRVIPDGRNSRKALKGHEGSPDAELRDRIADDARERRLLAFPAGRLRNSSVCGVIGNVLRHTDGSYTKAYRLSVCNSIYDDDGVVDGRIDDLGSLVGSGSFPPGTTFQFRFNATPDAGSALKRHLDARGTHGTHPLAGLLHASSVGFYEQAASQRLFRSLSLSLWVKVPAKHSNDKTGFSAFLPSVARELKRRGLKGFLKSFPEALGRAAAKSVVARTLADEEEALKAAGQVFKAVEDQCPTDLQLEPMTRAELWDAVYRSHRQNAVASPALPDRLGLDVRDYLCAETIQGTGWFLLHGSYPVSVVSAFLPPRPIVTADSMRKLTANPALTSRHVVITEFVCLEHEKAKKALENAISETERTGNTLLGRKELKHDAKARKEDLNLLLADVERGQRTLIESRFYVVVYGRKARTRAELEASIDQLDADCGAMVAAIKRIPGADAEREEPAALRAMYLRSLAGDFDRAKTGREQPEVGDSMAALIPTEGAWPGSPRPHTIYTTPSGQLTAIDLYDRSKIKSPTVLITSASGEGKSVTGGGIINDCLAHIPDLDVAAIDYYRSLGPLVDLLHGRHIRFDEGNARPINSWYYPGLSRGEYPDKIQLAYVQGDIRILAGVDAKDAISKSIIKTIVEEVYKIAVPRNKPGLPDFEPTLSTFLDVLKRYQWKERVAREYAEKIYLALNTFRRDSLLDAPTDPEFKSPSRFDVFELDSLSALDESVRASIAYRIAAQVMRKIGDKLPDGRNKPVLLVFDEMKEIIKNYPAILEVIEHATRMGRKEGVVTLLMSQAYEDFIGTNSEPNPIGTALAKNSGVKLIGKQIGNYQRLAADCGLSENAVAAVQSIKNIAGRQSQWLAVIGSGIDMTVEMFQVNLSPAELWAFTTDTNEKNARVAVANVKPHWPLAVVVATLAQKYPQGLTAEGLTEPDQEWLEALAYTERAAAA